MSQILNFTGEIQTVDMASNWWFYRESSIFSKKHGDRVLL